MKTIKSISAILAGILVNVVFSTGTEIALESAGIFPALGGELFVT